MLFDSVLVTNAALTTEADEEAARVRRARQLLQVGDRRTLDWCEADGPWALIARRSALRRRLGAHVLLIWRVSCEDGNGRCVERQLVATIVGLTSDLPRDRRQRNGTLREVEQKARELVEASDVWRATAAETASAVVQAQLARQRATAAAAGHGSLDECDDAHHFQAGLFDRRAERRHLLSAAAAAAMQHQAVERIGVLERSAAIGPVHAQLVLLVLP
jgi:hypothetical protein